MFSTRRRLVIAVGAVSLAVGASSLVFGVLTTTSVSGQTGTEIPAYRYLLRSIPAGEFSVRVQQVDVTGEIKSTDFLTTDTQSNLSSKLPTGLKPPTVVVSRVWNEERTFSIWHEAARRGDVKAGRRDAELLIVDRLGVAIGRWLLDDAYPSELQVTTAADGTPVETVTFVSEFLRRTSPATGAVPVPSASTLPDGWMRPLWLTQTPG